MTNQQWWDEAISGQIRFAWVLPQGTEILTSDDIRFLRLLGISPL